MNSAYILGCKTGTGVGEQKDVSSYAKISEKTAFTAVNEALTDQWQSLCRGKATVSTLQQCHALLIDRFCYPVSLTKNAKTDSSSCKESYTFWLFLSVFSPGD